MKRKKHAAILRATRKIHRQAGIFLFAIIAIVAISGLLLGWKKNVPALQYPTQLGEAKSVGEWLPMDTLLVISNRELVEKLGTEYSTALDKIDARPDKGIVKVIYAEHYYSLQLDAATGAVLSLEYRMSDLIEHVHDGTLVDRYFGLPDGIFKLFYTSLMSLALLTFSTTGFWLYYGPKVMRKDR